MSHERLSVSGAELDDLDLSALDAFVTARAPTLRATLQLEDVALRLGLVVRSAPRVTPTPVGLLLFGKTPQLVAPDWGVAAVCIDGTTLSDPVRYRLDLEGNVASLLSQGLAFVRGKTEETSPPHSTAAASLAGDADEYPEAAVREALVNALLHRDLRRAGRIALRRFHDRLEIWSPGGLPEGLSDVTELLREGGVSHPRNPILAALARAMGIGEQLGRGLAVLARVGGSYARRVEVHSSPRDVLVVIPSHWQRSPVGAC
jgi:ATP-dependent DNA helicase RecG